MSFEFVRKNVNNKNVYFLMNAQAKNYFSV